MDWVYRVHFIGSTRVIGRFSIHWRWRGIWLNRQRNSYYCECAVDADDVGIGHKRKKQLVFMGSPTVAANVLEKLLDASHVDGSIFDVSAIVTQPASGRSRGRKNIHSPVAQRALDKSFPSDRIFTPEKAGEEKFLADLRELKPDLCVTAAYGNILPNRFLKIPKHGTVNIHPSLLPLYRGAAPVQRALQDGVRVTGVSVAFTVRALDAGPIIASESLEIDDSIKAPELLDVLFDHGTHILLRELPSILNGSAAAKAIEQDNSIASLAPKVSTEESWLCFDQSALVLHNKVRSFAGWPGTRAKVEIRNDTISESQIVELKIVTTRVGSHNMNINTNNVDEIILDGDALIFCCGGGSTLEVLELQPSGKKVMNARDFWNGLRGRKLFKA